MTQLLDPTAPDQIASPPAKATRRASLRRATASAPSRRSDDGSHAGDDGQVFVAHTTPSDAADTESTDVWGFADTSFAITAEGHATLTGNRYPLSGQALPYLLPWVEQTMGIKVPRTAFLTKKPSEQLPPPSLHPRFVAEATALLGSARVDGSDAARRRHSHGHTQEEMYSLKYGVLARVPDVVLLPSCERDVAAIVELARAHNVCLVPYGGGTNVTEALRAPNDEARMVAVVSLKHLDRILWIDEVNGMARIEAGAVGRHIVAALAERGFSLGHEPDSIEFSTLGGWIATNASGMKKNKYGNIEQLVLDMTVVTAHGTIIGTHTGPRQSVGVDVERCLFGSEGTLGIITSAVVKLFPLPSTKRYGSCLFPDFQAGISFLYALKRAGAEPASARLVDNTQFQLGQALKTAKTGLAALRARAEKALVVNVKGFAPERMVACTFVYEGSEEEVALQQKRVALLAKRFGGMAAGADNGRRGYQLTYSIAYIRDFVMQHGILAESFETSLPWTGIAALCARVKERIAHEHRVRNLPGRPLVTARVTQIYDTGAAVYFYFAMCFVGVDDPSGTYAAIERAAREEVLAAGGSLSHHHGVGKLRQPFLEDVMNQTALHVRRQLKAAMDPTNVFGLANGPLPA